MEIEIKYADHTSSDQIRIQIDCHNNLCTNQGYITVDNYGIIIKTPGWKTLSWDKHLVFECPKCRQKE